MPNSPKLYFVKVDVKSAFDSIKLDKLFEVLDEVLSTVSNHLSGAKGPVLILANQDEHYVLRKYVRILPSSGRKPKKYGSVAQSRRRLT